MLKNYLKTAIRNLVRNRLYTFINVFGLTVGLASCMFIFLYLNNELRYDKFHHNPDRVYRLIRTADYKTEGIRYIGVTSGPFAEAILTDFEGIVEQTLRVENNNGLITYGEKAFLEDKLFLADSNFFMVLNFPLVVGNKETVLNGGSKVVISSALAIKYFGDDDPIGKILEMDNQVLIEVTGVFDKALFDSHLDFDLVVSISIIKNLSYFKDWWSNSLSTYVVLKDGKKKNDLEPHLQGFMDKYFGKDFERTGRKMGLVMEPLEDIYFNNQTQFDRVNHGDKKTIYVFTVVTILVFLIAIVNFINLSSATSSSRAVEIGVRKTNGASRISLIIQFLIESMIVTLLATIISMLIVEVGLPYFSNFIGKSLTIPLSTLEMVFVSLGLVVVCGTLAGFYPAVVLSSFEPSKVLKKNMATFGSGLFIRKALVVFQFGISIFLIIATMVTWIQLQYIGKKKLGFYKENILLVNFDNNEIRRNAQTFKERISAFSEVKDITIMSGEPGGFHDSYSFEVEGFEQQQILRTVFSDYEYLKVFNLEMVEGRSFSRDHSTDITDALLINQEAAKTLGWTIDEAIGKEIRNNFRDNNPRKVIGVVKDFHFRSLKEPIGPLVISMNRDYRVAAIRLQTPDLAQAIRKIEEEWSNHVDRYPMNYRFLDESLNRLYQDEQNQANLFQVFGLIAITIACLGLFGLATLTTQKRMKEIGVRKVLGANLSDIIYLLSKNFLILVLVASLIVIPLGWLAMENWLSNFEYRIQLQVWYFIAATAIALLIALLTVAYHSFKAAFMNPTETLRYE